MSLKIDRGQFNTKGRCWLRQHIIEFILNSGKKVILDPFAGEGDLLSTCKDLLGIEDVFGYDIDLNLNDRFGWRYNNSLEDIPYIDGATHPR